MSPPAHLGAGEAAHPRGEEEEDGRRAHGEADGQERERPDLAERETRDQEGAAPDHRHDDEGHLGEPPTPPRGGRHPIDLLAAASGHEDTQPD
jgi:hypothetical protein